MRTFIIAVVVLTVILASVTGYYLYCDKTVKNLQALALSEGIVTADGANKIFSYWEKWYGKRLSCSLYREWSIWCS